MGTMPWWKKGVDPALPNPNHTHIQTHNQTNLEAQDLGHGLAVGAGVGRLGHLAQLGVHLAVVVPGLPRVLGRVLCECVFNKLVSVCVFDTCVCVFTYFEAHGCATRVCVCVSLCVCTYVCGFRFSCSGLTWLGWVRSYSSTHTHCLARPGAGDWRAQDH